MNIGRVTAQTQWASLRSDLSSAAKRTEEATSEVATGRKVRTVSDAPTEAATILRYDEQSAALEAYAKQATDANAWLAAADTALMSTSTVIAEALGVVKAASNGALSTEARAALADQLDALRSHLFDLASSTHLGQPIFGGFGAAAVSKDATGTVSYTGTSGQVLRQVSPTTTVAVNTDGAAAFGFAAGDDLFTVLADAAAAARANDLTGLSATHTRLEARHTDALTALHTVGSTQNLVNSSTDRAASVKLSLAAARSDLVDVDIPKAAMDMQLAQDGYEAVLAAISRTARMPSLAELLR